jgi:hypothetical protein
LTRLKTGLEKSGANAITNFIRTFGIGKSPFDFSLVGNIKMNLPARRSVFKYQSSKLDKVELRSCLKTQKGFSRRSINRIIAI